jgi:hypothetical protein
MAIGFKPESIVFNQNQLILKVHTIFSASEAEKDGGP